MARKIKDYRIAPDEIFLDDSNLPSLNTHQFEGRIERPISKFSLYLTGVFFATVAIFFLGRVAYLQIVSGQEYAERSKNNSLRQTVILPSRGIIYDRNGVELAWNKPERAYINQPGFSTLLGYLGFPNDNEVTGTSTFAEKEHIGRAGIEKQMSEALTGTKGLRVEEVNVKGEVVSESSLKQAGSGQAVTLSIDSRLQTQFFTTIKSVVLDRGFGGGSGIIINVKTGELLALTSFPEYDSNIMTSHSDSSAITAFFTDPRKPFLDRAVSGLYAPGSIFKPIVALGALNEHTIDPLKQIFSSGQLEIPNPYNPKEKTIFKDWKAHGWVDMRQAIARSSDEYFYQVGGGFQGQKGLGIANIEKYARMFGLATTTGIELPNEAIGVIPSPEWKATVFNGEPWRLGNTYHTAIGQYGVQVTPIQMARAVATIANKGTLLKPTILKWTGSTTPPSEKLPIPREYFEIIHEGMRLGVSSANGTGHGLDVPYVKITSKTGTAELGVSKSRVNSWVMGFWPYDNPQYAFVVSLESGPRTNTIGGVFVMRTMFDWMWTNLPEYLK